VTLIPIAHETEAPFALARAAASQLQVAAADIQRGLALTGRVQPEALAALHVITMYCESVEVLLNEISDGVGARRPEHR
jgi:hypothetical protein